MCRVCVVSATVQTSYESLQSSGIVGRSYHDTRAIAILWNAVTSPETVLIGNSVKTKLYKTPSPILHCISQLGDSNEGQDYWVSQNTRQLSAGPSPIIRPMLYPEVVPNSPSVAAIIGSIYKYVHFFYDGLWRIGCNSLRCWYWITYMYANILGKIMLWT